MYSAWNCSKGALSKNLELTDQVEVGDQLLEEPPLPGGLQDEGAALLLVRAEGDGGAAQQRGHAHLGEEEAAFKRAEHQRRLLRETDQLVQATEHRAGLGGVCK